MKDFLRRTGIDPKGSDSPGPGGPGERVNKWLRNFAGVAGGPETLPDFLDHLEACLQQAALIPLDSMTASQAHDLTTLVEVISVFRGLLTNI